MLEGIFGSVALLCKQVTGLKATTETLVGLVENCILIVADLPSHENTDSGPLGDMLHNIQLWMSTR